MLGAIAGGALIAARRVTRKSAIPFGPFMLAGAFVALFFAGTASNWYGDLLNHTLHRA
jgi:leader peptidase (prepilin peptidase)/N-methyltransferase